MIPRASPEPAEPPRRPRHPAPSPRPQRPGHPRDTESPRSFRPVALDHDPTPNDLHSPCPPWYSPQRTQAKPVSTSPCQPQPRSREQPPGAGTPATREEAHSRRSQRREEGQRRAPPPTEGRSGGPGGRPPEEHCEPLARGQKSPEHSATPGGYGGKPPGVAFIGVPTGARNAGSDAPTGDQSIDMNRTRKHPLVCQDPITTRSRDEPEQAQSPAD